MEINARDSPKRIKNEIFVCFIIFDIVLILLILLYGGYIGEEEERDHQEDHHGLPSNPEPWLWLEVGMIVQTNVTCWDTNVTIGMSTNDTLYKVDDITFQFRSPEGSTLTDAQWSYFDRDADGFFSNHDLINITNMTEEYENSHLLVYHDGNVLGGENITWDEEDRRNYLLWLRPGEYRQVDETHWDTNFTVEMIRGDCELDVSKLTFIVHKGGSTFLTSGAMELDDADNNSVISVCDGLEITGMTEQYQGAHLWLIYEDIRIGYRQLPYFTKV